MIKVGVIQRQITLNNTDIYDAVETKLYTYFRELNIDLVPIPNYFGLPGKAVEFKDWLDEYNLGKFLFSGGGDPFKPDERYFLEQHIMSMSKLQFSPIFGICRGLERMIIHEGGTLQIVQGHINSKTESKGIITGNFNCFHSLKIEKLPPNFTVTSVSTDDVIEAVSHNIYPWAACMWHPERSHRRNVMLDERILKLYE